MKPQDKRAKKVTIKDVNGNTIETFDISITFTVERDSEEWWAFRELDDGLPMGTLRSLKRWEHDLDDQCECEGCAGAERIRDLYK